MLVLVADVLVALVMAQLMPENSDGNFLQRRTWTIQKGLLPRHRRHLQLGLALPSQVTSSFRFGLKLILVAGLDDEPSRVE